MNCSKDCKYFANINNTDETRQGICRFGTEFLPTKLDNSCPFAPREWAPTCSDCDRLGNDFACMSCSAEDSAIHNGEICGGFIDIVEVDFMKALYKLKMQQRYDKNIIEGWIEKFEKDFKTPQD